MHKPNRTEVRLLFTSDTGDHRQESWVQEVQSFLLSRDIIHIAGVISIDLWRDHHKRNIESLIGYKLFTNINTPSSYSLSRIQLIDVSR